MRVEVLRALTNLGPLAAPAAEPIAKTLREDESTWVQALAATALGRIGVASQSGNFVSSFMNLARSSGVGISRAVSAGNAAAVTVADYLDWFADDAETAVVSTALRRPCQAAFNSLFARAASSGSSAFASMTKVRSRMEWAKNAPCRWSAR